MMAGEPLDNVINTLKKLIRPTLIPEEGNVFVVGDWGQVESRMLAWLSDSRGGDAKLELFRSGVDIYEVTAKSIGIPDRQIGKVADLSLGFGGAAGAFNAMAASYGVELPDHQVKRIVDQWRNANQWAVKFWRDLENAGRRAIMHPGEVYHAGRIRYMFAPQLIEGTLICILPDNSSIQYPVARIEKIVHPKFGAMSSITAMKAAWTPKADAKEWVAPINSPSQTASQTMIRIASTSKL